MAEDTKPAIVRISFQGRSHAVVPPNSVIEQEELWVAWNSAAESEDGHRLLRAGAALLGACTRVGREAAASYADCNCNALVYGGKVYDHLVSKGEVDGLVVVAVDIHRVLTDRLLAFREAKQRADFSGPGEGRSTGA